VSPAARLLLSQIELLRNEASDLALASHPKELDPVEWMATAAYRDMRLVLRTLEARIEKLLPIYWKEREVEQSCPFCGYGEWEITGTVGRLSCSKCRAIALIGVAHEVKKIEA